MNRLQTTPSAAGVEITRVHNAAGWVTDVAYVADGETVSNEYNALGQRLSMTDANGTTQYEYDDLNRLTVVTDTFGAVVEYGYDLNGNRTQLVYPPSTGSGQAGKVVTYTYDADNRLDSLLDWSGGLTDYDYDEAGRLITTTLPNGVVSVNGYDDANRLTSLRYVDGGGDLLAEYLYELDGVGNRTVVTETLLAPGIVETVEAFLEENGQLVLEAESATTVEVAGQGWLTQTAQSGYAGDSYLQALPDVGQRLEEAANSPQAQFTVNIQTSGDYTVWARGMAPDAGGDSLRLALDGDGSGNGPLTGFTEAWAWTKLTMDNADASLTLSSGVHELTAAMREDGLRLDKLLLTTDSTVPSGSGPVESGSQTITTTNTAPQLGAHVITYDYDPLYRLTEAVYSGDEYNATHAYAFDAVGNRTAYTTTITNTTVITYQYNAANQLLESAEIGGDATTYEWDDAGRLITTTVGVNVSRVYTYSQDADLTAALVDGLLTTFVYDGDGHRLQMSVAGEVTTYTLDYGAGFRVLYEQGGDFAETKHYLYGYSCIGEEVDADNPATQEWRYYLFDSNSNVRQATNAQAEVTLAWRYSPEGIVLFGEEGPVTHLVCEGNGIYDFSTGLIFKNGNYFDPNTGIWITLGSIGVWNAWNHNATDNRKQKSKRAKWVVLLFMFLLCILLVGCNPTPLPTPTPTCTPIPMGPTEPFPSPIGNNVIFVDPPVPGKPNAIKWNEHTSREKEAAQTALTDALINKYGGPRGFGNLHSAFLNFGVSPQNPIQLIREPISQGIVTQADASSDRPYISFYNIYFNGSVSKMEGKQKSTMAHELAHYWEQNLATDNTNANSLNSEMKKWVQNGIEPTNYASVLSYQEDFPETVELYFYYEEFNFLDEGRIWTDNLGMGAELYNNGSLPPDGEDSFPWEKDRYDWIEQKFSSFRNG